MKKILLPIISLIVLSFINSDIRISYWIPYMAQSVCTADIDNDGDKELITSHYFDSRYDWGGLNILDNLGDGYFEDLKKVNDSLIRRFLMADTIINKQSLDIISFGVKYAKIYSNLDKNVSITKVYIGEGLTYGDLGDIDNNGYLDLIIASNNYRFWGIVYNNGDGTFAQPIYYDLETYPTDILCSDVNNDGLDDIILMNEEIEIHINQGSSFKVVKIPAVASKLDVVDFNNDGLMDIISYLGLTRRVKLFQNMGTDSFELKQEFWLTNISAGFVCSDFDNDNLIDLLFYTSPFGGETGYYLYHNLDNFSFKEPQFITLETQGEEYRYTISDDIDNNGYNDIITCCWLNDTTYSSASRLELLYNDGKGNFLETPPISVVEEDEEQITFNVFPNPIINDATIEINLNKKAYIKLNIYDIFGNQLSSIIDKPIKQGKYIQKLNNGIPKIRLSKGIYIAILEIDGSNSISKIFYIN